MSRVEWQVPQSFTASFRWDYDDGRQELLALYDKGKRRQWNANERIDWSQELDPENPSEIPDQAIPIFGSSVFEGLSKQRRIELRHHFQAWQVSQFLHGEQAALMGAAKIVQQVPSIDAKFYAATQVMDEARHVEAYARLLNEKLKLAYPISPPLAELVEQVLRDSRWDVTYLGIQVLIEGLALASFSQIRDKAQNPLVAAINAYVMQDEARHVAFGRLALRDYYPQLTQVERDEREELTVEACYVMRDRFDAREVWERLELPMEECVRHVRASPSMVKYRTALFSRIVPTIKDIGLWGPKIRTAYEKLGVLGFAGIDLDLVSVDDERAADAFDARRQEVAKVIEGSK